MEGDHSPPKLGTAATQAASLTTLPNELKYNILLYLTVPEAIRLRATCRTFYTFIRQPTHAEWLLIEREGYFIARNLIACGGCCRLRHHSKFSYHMRTAPPEREWTTKLDTGGRSFTISPSIQVLGNRDPLAPGGRRAGERFCNECGAMDLEGTEGKWRYKVGQIWDEQGVSYVRCANCERIEQAPDRGDLSVCRWCYEAMKSEVGLEETE